jgi:hypothetical protein
MFATVPRWVPRALAVGAGAAIGAYSLLAGAAWLRYGRPSAPDRDECDDLLDRFMPKYDVVERHRIGVAAPAHVTLDAASEQDLLESGLTRAIFKAREAILRASPLEPRPPRGLLAAVQAMGWGVLAEVPGREIVLGAVTRPWEANVTFRALPPDEFAAFSAPGFVKIAWTLRADAIGAQTSMFRTETRAVATDAAARYLFRRYWAFFSPGIALIRQLSLGPVKREAERRASQGRAAEEVGVW